MLRETEAPQATGESAPIPVPSRNGEGEVTASRQPAPQTGLEVHEARRTAYAQITGWGMYVPSQVVLNEEFVRYFFGDRNPLGRKLTQGSGNWPRSSWSAAPPASIR